MNSNICAALVLACLCATRVFAENTQSSKMDELKQSLLNQAYTIAAAADSADTALQRYKWNSKATTQARALIAEMQKSCAWRDLTSRDTRKSDGARTTLQSYLVNARRYIASAARELSALQEAEYQVWAKEHPEEARTLELQKRLKAAEDVAAGAAMMAEDAQAAAARASEDAQYAQDEAARARRQAEQANQKANRAEIEAQRNKKLAW